MGYTGRGRHSQYICANAKQQGHTMQQCWSVVAAPIDAAVAARVLESVAPEAIALGIAVSAQAAAEVATLDQQWALRVQRARYEAQLAERRYKAVDPENRTVAQTLEHEWEASLQSIDRLEKERDAVRVQARLALSEADRGRIEALSRDVPALWHATTTTNAQRKSIVRALVREVCRRQSRPADFLRGPAKNWLPGGNCAMGEVRRPPNA